MKSIFMKRHQLLLGFILFFISFSIQAQTNYGAEIVTNQKFGEGLMVVRAKITTISGTVNNIFFFNREDSPWNGNVWYEYDWEIRGKYPYNGWSQIRVRSNNGEQLRDAPEDVSTSVNLGNKLYNYILIRKGNDYIYDIREDFDIRTYNYTNASAHGSNSTSLIVGGPRIYTTGGSVANIPTWKKLDFNLGITAFDNGWTGSLPSGSYSGDMEIDYARFYEIDSDGDFNTFTNWSDEFNSNQLDIGKWNVADWQTSATQFTQNNIRFENGKIILTISRDSGGTSYNVVTMQKRNAMNYALDGGNGGDNKQDIYLWSYNPNNVNQQWIEIDRGNGYYTYQKKNTNYCMDGNNGGGKRQNVYLYTCKENNQNQHWRKVWVAENTYRLEKRNASSYSLDGNNGGGNRQSAYLWTNGNTNENQHWVFTVVGTARMEQAQDVELLIYPNPFNSHFTIELPNDIDSDMMMVQLTDITGKIVYQKSQLATGQIIQISKDLPNGVYTLVWIDEKNQLFNAQKVIKQ